MSEQPLFGLIGYPLSHSFSPEYFGKKFAREGIGAVYQAFPLESITHFQKLITDHKSLHGLNVTIPYKQAIIPYLDKLDGAAEAVGAVNCIDIRDGKAKGYNTDITGFQRSLEPLLQAHHNKALILGTGGASLAVAYVLEQLRIPYTKVSRHRSAGILAYEDIDEATISGHPLIINTTPLGMYPEVHTAPALPYTAINPSHMLYDLIYNPTETRFLKLGKEQGATIKNGYEMLVLQADASWDIWNR